MINTCGLFDDQDKFKEFLKSAIKDEVEAVLFKLDDLITSFKNKSIPQQHLSLCFDIGQRFYKRRFKEKFEPVPF